MSRDDFSRLPEIEAGSRMPGHHTIVAGDSQRRFEAEEGSRRLLEALQKYYRKLRSPVTPSAPRTVATLEEISRSRPLTQRESESLYQAIRDERRLRP